MRGFVSFMKKLCRDEIDGGNKKSFFEWKL